MIQLKPQLKNKHQSPEAGYTIIESLVAMIMVAALMVAVAPVIVFSVGTRVQARRVELASQAARSYIDWVRLNPVGEADEGNAPNVIAVDLKDALAPTSGGLYCKAGEYCTTPARAMYNDLYCVDNDGDGECTSGSLADMVVQGLRSSNSVNAEDGYALGVRVYRADAFQEATLCAGRVGDSEKNENCPKVTQQSTVTNAIGNRQLPVVQVFTEIAPTKSPFRNLRDRLDN